MTTDLRRRVADWIATDPDDTDRRTLRSLLDSDDLVELDRRFATPLRFGTAGLRGPEMAGPAGMNRATVRRATQGVLAWLNEIGVDAARGVVVGRDARHGSERFNDEVVTTLLGAGAVVYEMPSPLPTPYVPYCVRACGAAAGIMITASHNPRDENGFKLYGPDGAQIVAPDDATVERHASGAGPAAAADRSARGHSIVTPETFVAYRDHFVQRFGVVEDSNLAITYTPMHGVGGETMRQLLSDAGFARVDVVRSQFVPDGSFPTLRFPNPEEAGALDHAVVAANTAGSTLIIANDPDADRLGAAVRGPEGWRILRGDEIGWLLGSSLLDDIRVAGQCVATSIVSSTLLEKMARSADVTCVTTLTGFKWISRAAPWGELGFGYEEALGFAVDPCVPDKDGLSAGLALCHLAHTLSREGRTLLDELDDIESRFGVHATAQLAWRAESEHDLGEMRGRIARLLAAPPGSVGPLNVDEVIDLSDGWRAAPPTEGVVLGFAGDGRVVIRPSGTEAKVKAYFEVTPPRVGTLAAQRERAADVVASLQRDVAALLREQVS